MMNRQEIFDKVAVHLLTQNKRSKNTDVEGDPYCKYRGTDNLMCAAGILITDDRYKVEMENKGWDKLIPIYPELQEITDEGGHTVINDLQSTHDVVSVEDWKLNLKTYAHTNNLDYSCIENF